MKPLSLLTAFTIGLVLGNRTGRHSEQPHFFLTNCSESNGDAVVRLRSDCAE